MCGCRLLARLLERGRLAQLLPVFDLPALPPGTRPTRQQRAQRALHAFWKAAAADALLCFQQPVMQCLQSDAAKRVAAAVAEFTATPKLLPLNAQAAAAAGNTLFGLLGQQQPLDGVERLCQQHGQQLELMMKEGQPTGGEQQAAAAPVMFRPGSFTWSVAEAALQLVAAFVQAGAAAAAGTPLSPGMPAPAPEAAPAAVGWRGLPAGFQWALACFPVLGRLVLTAGPLVAEMLSKPYLEVQEAASAAMGAGMPARLRIKRTQQQRQQQAAAAAPPQSAAAVVVPAAQPAASAMGNAPGGMPAAPPPAGQQQGGEAAEPTASSMGPARGVPRQLQPAAPAMSVGAASCCPPPTPRRPLHQQQQGQHGQPLIKQEPLPRPAAAQQPRPQQQQQPAAQHPRQQGQVAGAEMGQQHQPQARPQHFSRDLSFAELSELPLKSVGSVVGLLCSQPEIKVGPDEKTSAFSTCKAAHGAVLMPAC